ncbi:hypothetical protein FO519_007592 [Halicephalobus sp. NKZ332]|nr:hypothetical protein FO519_007592 [Halicephalobus sp. NKZ332]
MNKLWTALFLAFASLDYGRGDTCAWDTCPTWSNDPNWKNIHFIPHTHDDMGWLKTADDYYTGANPQQVNVGVQYIINTVVAELMRNSSRRFSYAETGFLTRWLEDHDTDTVNQFIQLVKNGQMELIGGGWVQPDEAATHYIELLDMYTVGLRKLKSIFGDQCGIPRTGWQIDPFGHSREHTNLLKLMGYESLYFAREDFREHINRRTQKRLEFNWYTSNEDPTRSLLTGVFPDHYGPPDFLDWDIGNFKSVPVIDNPDLENYNVADIAQKLATDVNIRTSIQPHNHYIYMLGSDFQYSDANHYFANMDRLMKYVNGYPNFQNMTIHYSNPSCYTKAIVASNTIKTNKTYDFFPYANDLHSYWTGYFTSKPSFKGLVRRSSNILNTFRQITTFAKLPNIEEFTSPENKLERAVSLALHHDGITGTSKEFVTQNYEQRIFKAYPPAQDLLNQGLKALNKGDFPTQNFCLLINETICDFTNSNVQNFSIVVYNSNSQPAHELVKIPIYHQFADVYNENGTSVVLKWVIPSFQVPNQLNGSIASIVLYFIAEIPANGFTTYFVVGSSSKSAIPLEKPLPPSPKANTITNGLIELTFDENNKLSIVKDLTTKTAYPISQDFFYYEGHDNHNKSHASGAYIFRPQVDGEPTQISGKPDLTLFGIEARQVFSDYVSQTIRIPPENNFIEFEWTIGPLPKVSRNLTDYGKEVVTRYTASGIGNNGTFYTDANGRQMMKRQLFQNPDFTFGGDEMVAGNFYPVNTRAYITDGKDTLVVLTDRSQGVSAVNLDGGIKDGSLQFMLHRRDYYDDGYGVGEALNEPGRDGRGLVVRGIHRVFVGAAQTVTTTHRQAAYELYHQPIVSFASINSIDSYKKSYITSYSGLASPLPNNVHIVTLKQLSPGQVLLRLENIYAVNEDPDLSKPVTVDLTKLFKDLQVTAVQELTLAANQVVDGSTSSTVTLNPQEIKTFQLTVQ